MSIVPYSHLDSVVFNVWTCISVKKATLATSHWPELISFQYISMSSSKRWGLLLLTDSDLDLECFSLYSLYICLFLKRVTIATSHWLWTGLRIFQFISLSFSENGDPCYFSLALIWTQLISVYKHVFLSKGWGLLHLTDYDLDLAFFSWLWPELRIF